MQGGEGDIEISVSGRTAERVRHLAGQYGYLCKDVLAMGHKLAADAVEAKPSRSNLPPKEFLVAWDPEGDIQHRIPIPGPGQVRENSDITQTAATGPEKNFRAGPSEEGTQGPAGDAVRLRLKGAQANERGYSAAELVDMGIKMVEAALHADEQYKVKFYVADTMSQPIQELQLLTREKLKEMNAAPVSERTPDKRFQQAAGTRQGDTVAATQGAASAAASYTR